MAVSTPKSTIKLLVDQQATAVAIKDGLDWLTHQVTDRDVGIVYLAGHGTVENSRFYFLAADSDANRLRATAVAKDDVHDALDNLAGKALLFLDACHAGSLVTGHRGIYDNNEVINDFLHSERGVVVFAASTGRQESMEDPSWGNGAFTKALVEGLGSPGVPALAKIAGNDAITPAILDAYIAQACEGPHGRQTKPGDEFNGAGFPICDRKVTGGDALLPWFYDFNKDNKDGPGRWVRSTVLPLMRRALWSAKLCRARA